MKEFIDRVRMARWTYRQSLTTLPSMPDSRISDLFVWRNSTNWQTFFELIDIASLFEKGIDKVNSADIILFNSEGYLLLREKINLISNQRQVIDISELLSKSKQNGRIGELGTFAVFHSTIPDIIPALNSFIAERGYVSYKYKNLPLRSYVHGNLDAISTQSDELSMLGGRGLLMRQYQLQFELRGSRIYELGVVNTSNKKAVVKCAFIPIVGGSVIAKNLEIEPKGVGIFSIKLKLENSFRAIIISQLVMARPLIFSSNKKNFDVFHG